MSPRIAIPHTPIAGVQTAGPTRFVRQCQLIATTPSHQIRDDSAAQSRAMWRALQYANNVVITLGSLGVALLMARRNTTYFATDNFDASLSITAVRGGRWVVADYHSLKRGSGRGKHLCDLLETGLAPFVREHGVAVTCDATASMAARYSHEYQQVVDRGARGLLRLHRLEWVL